jgi:hypothetical protein
LKKDAVWDFGPSQKKAWDTLKEALIKAPVLIQANPLKEYFVDTDASGMGIGAALMQFGQDGKLHPIAYMSRNYKPGEAKYHTRDQEALAIYWSVLKLDEYLSAKKFYVITSRQFELGDKSQRYQE